MLNPVFTSENNTTVTFSRLGEKSYTRPHLFIGEVDDTGAHNFFGFRIGHIYPLRYSRTDKGEVIIKLDHLAGSKELIMSAARFEKWFQK